MPKYNVKIDRNNIIMVLVLLNAFVGFCHVLLFPKIKMSLTNIAKLRTLNFQKYKSTTMHTKPFTIIKNCKVSYQQISKQVMGINQYNHLYLLDYNKRDRNMDFDISFTCIVKQRNDMN